MKKIKYVCKVCGKPYESYKETSKYCSRPCRKKDNNFDVVCGTCGKPFSVYRSRYEKVMSGEIGGFYCSRECADISNITASINTCQYCGKQFRIFNCFKDVQKYCSMECYREYKHSNAEDYSMTRFVRSNMKTWKDNEIVIRGQRCELTGETKNLTLHHIRSFNLLLKETLDILGLDVHTKTNELSEDVLQKILDIFKEVQNKYPTIVITTDIHKLFHHEYGYGYNTEEQWNEFVERHKNEFKKIA